MPSCPAPGATAPRQEEAASHAPRRAPRLTKSGRSEARNGAPSWKRQGSPLPSNVASIEAAGLMVETCLTKWTIKVKYIRMSRVISMIIDAKRTAPNGRPCVVKACWLDSCHCAPPSSCGADRPAPPSLCSARSPLSSQSTASVQFSSTRSNPLGWTRRYAIASLLSKWLLQGLISTQNVHEHMPAGATHSHPLPSPLC